MEDKNQYGALTCGSGTPQEREIPIDAYFSGSFLDGRRATVAELVNNEGFVLYAQNDIGTTRSPETSIWLSEGSFIAMISSALLFCQKRGYDWQEKLEGLVADGKIKYSCSDNLDTNDQPPAKD